MNLQNDKEQKTKQKNTKQRKTEEKYIQTKIKLPNIEQSFKHESHKWYKNYCVHRMIVHPVLIKRRLDPPIRYLTPSLPELFELIVYTSVRF